ncbi:MAG: hypothetical protein H7258_14105 [Ferruginibacter sp.]|nr:hypothetical protein [Ferruginibacter sp.]
MSDDLKDILSNLNKDIEQDKLLEYLNKNLPHAAQHEFEKQMNDDEFMNDAVEGLEQLENKKNIPAYIQQLNAGLKKQLETKKKRKEKRKLPPQYWTWFTIILLLILVVVAWVIIRQLIWRT